LLKNVVKPLPLTLSLTLPLHLLGWAPCQVEAIGFVLVGRVAAMLEAVCVALVGLQKRLREQRLELCAWVMGFVEARVLALIMVQRYILAVTCG
jgi:hypothetical protein